MNTKVNRAVFAAPKAPRKFLTSPHHNFDGGGADRPTTKSGLGGICPPPMYAPEGHAPKNFHDPRLWVNRVSLKGTERVPSLDTPLIASRMHSFPRLWMSQGNCPLLMGGEVNFCPHPDYFRKKLLKSGQLWRTPHFSLFSILMYFPTIIGL